MHVGRLQEFKLFHTDSSSSSVDVTPCCFRFDPHKISGITLLIGTVAQGSVIKIQRPWPMILLQSQGVTYGTAYIQTQQSKTIVFRRPSSYLAYHCADLVTETGDFCHAKLTRLNI